MSIPDYPSFDDNRFYEKIYSKKEFYECRYKDKWWEQWSDTNKPFQHLPHQKLVYMYFAPWTYYMSGLLFHGCGSGKSECANQIVESNRIMLDEHQKSAILLLPNDLVMGSILSDLLGKEVMPDGTTRFVKKGTGNKYIGIDFRKYLNDINNHVHTSECQPNCHDLLQGKIKKVIRHVKKEKLLQYYELETHQRFAKYVYDDTIENIQEKYSNTVIIVDEIHKSRNETKLYGALLKIATHCYNTKMIFMTGTPRVDREYEVLPIINLLRQNDGCEEMLDDNVIKQLFHKDSSVRKEAESKFGKSVKGYVSFIRGINPITFPIIKECGTRMFKNVNFNTIECFLRGKQLMHYINCFMDEFNPNIEANITNELWEKTRCASRCAYENTKDKDWDESVIGEISCKLEAMWNYAKKSKDKGPIMIYVFNKDTGINLVERFLKSNGVEQLTIENASKKSLKYVNFTNIKTAELRQRALDICRSHENFKGEYIKFILGTGKIRTGLSFKHLSQELIVEPDWNIPTTEQIIYRGARQFSHKHPYDKNSNQELEIYRMRSTFCDKYIDELPEQFKTRLNNFITNNYSQLKKRGFLMPKAKVSDNSNDDSSTMESPTKKHKIEERLITIDDYMYTTCIKKDIPGNRIERLFKVYAFDNPLQIKANYFPEYEDSKEYDYSRLANYDKIDYNVPIPDEFNMCNASNVKEPEVLDDSTYDLRDWVLLINDTGNTIEYMNTEIFDSILSLFNTRSSWRFYEITGVLNKLKPNVASKSAIPYILNWLVDTQYKFYNNNGEHGYIIYANDVYIWRTTKKSLNTGTCNLYDICESDTNVCHNYQTKYISIDKHLRYEDSFEDVFGSVKLIEDLSSLFIQDKLDRKVVSVDSSLVIKLHEDKLCATIENTKDNPNRFGMTFWNGSKKLAAVSKKVKELNNIAEKFGIIVDSNTKKDELCKKIRSKMIEHNCLLPWSPSKKPSLYRLYLVAKVWKLDNVLKLIDSICKDIIKHNGSIFVNAVSDIIALRKRPEDYVLQNIRQRSTEFFLKNSGTPDFILALLERMHGPRPTRLEKEEWVIVTRIYADQFHQTYCNTLSKIHTLFYNSINYV